MSRIASQPIKLPPKVDVVIDADSIKVKGPKGELSHPLNPFVKVEQVDQALHVSKVQGIRFRRDKAPFVRAIAGTIRANVNNMVIGVSAGFSKRLLLVGVGYRAQVQGRVLNLTLGFSHPVNFQIPEGVNIETPDQTTIVVSGSSKQLVGQVCADIRAYRPPEPYKGKGIRYADEQVKTKETKKK